MSTNEILQQLKPLAKELGMKDYYVQFKQYHNEEEKITIVMYENLSDADQNTLDISYEMYLKDYSWQKMEAALRERYSQAVYEIEQEKQNHIAADRLDDEIWERNEDLQDALNDLANGH